MLTSSRANLQIREVTRAIRGRPSTDGAGVKLTRIIGQPALDMLDPFLLLDEFRSAEAADYLGGFPEHPHRGFETVTYLLAGRMRHADSQGNHGLLTPGSVQWMTAGRGIVHSEIPEQTQGLLWGFQLWVNLPAREKMTTPRYQDIATEHIPTVSPAPGASVRVIAGVLGEVAGPVQGIATEPIYLDVHLATGATLTIELPPAHNGFVYVYEGQATIGSRPLRDLVRGDLGVLSHGAKLDVSTPVAPGRLLVVAGKPLNEPVARYGPFVMNTPDQIQQAIEDYRAGRI